MRFQGSLKGFQAAFAQQFGYGVAHHCAGGGEIVGEFGGAHKGRFGAAATGGFGNFGVVGGNDDARKAA